MKPRVTAGHRQCAAAGGDRADVTPAAALARQRVERRVDDPVADFAAAARRADELASVSEDLVAHAGADGHDAEVPRALCDIPVARGRHVVDDEDRRAGPQARELARVARFT